MDGLTDEQRMAVTLAAAEPIKAEIPAYDAFILCGLLQLAMRNPALLPDTPSHEVARFMIDNLKEVLEGIDPYLGELIQQSENPDNDVSILKPGGLRGIGEFF